MRIIHTADLHLDSRLKTNLDSIKAKERKKELQETFLRMVKYANDNDVNAIIIAGDMFDRPKIAIKTKEFVINTIKEYPNIDFIYISGNHDENSFIDTLIEKPKNLITFSDSWKTLNYGDIDITAINYDLKMNKYIYDTLFLNENKFNIVCLHGQLTKDEVDINRLKGKNIDYLALGHIHKYQKGTIDDRGIYIYPGCPEGRGFDEIGDKGFVLLDINNKKLESRFIKFAKRTIHEITVDISGTDSWNEIKRNVNLKINSISSDDMVRIKFVGNYDIQLIKQNEILLDSLNDQFYFASILDASKIAINPKDYENDISLKGEFIRGVLKSDLSDDEKNKVIEYGIKALMKEEI